MQALLGTEWPFLGGALAATLVTWFTFLPSFLFILAGGPLVESMHGDLKFTAPLTAITAAVVGVILNLALFFGYHVLWPEGFAGRFDWISALIAVAAAVALFRFKRGVIEVIGACAALGLVLQLALPSQGRPRNPAAGARPAAERCTARAFNSARPRRSKD